MSSLGMMESVEVYETSDLPEADQAILAARDDSSADSIETLHISANEAFGRFKAAYIEGGAVDFSDRLRSSRRKGYTVVWSGEPEREAETPAQKYQRLNCEARELQDEVAAARAGSSGLPPATLETLSGQVEALHRELVGLRLQDVLGDRPAAALDPQAMARSRLAAGLTVVRAGRPGPPAAYSIAMRPGEGGRRAVLEARLTALEAAIGLGQESFGILCMETNRKTLTQAIQVLAAKTSLLDPHCLDHVEGRLAMVQARLARPEQPPGRELEGEEAARLDSLLGTAETSRPLLAGMGETVSRVETLQSLHTQAADFSRQLVELETVQGQLSAQLGNNLALLKSTKEKFPANLEAIQQNFTSLFARLDRLQKMQKKK